MSLKEVKSTFSTNKTNQKMSVCYATATENNDLHTHTPIRFYLTNTKDDIINKV